MQPYGDVLGYRSIEPIMKDEVDASSSSFTMNLTEPADYCVLLTADDVAGNHIRARRFLIFDDVNVVDIDPTGHYPLWVDSAAVNTSHLWQTDIQDNGNNGPQVLMRWPGHFYNQFHRQHKMLNEIEDHSPPLTSDYEEGTGQPPETRSREAIPNINAIVQFEVDYAIDHEGGRSITTPTGNWRDVDDIMVEQQTFDIPREDGDSIRMWVRATDVMGNTNQDEILLHVDSSPPEVHGISLTKHGMTSLAVHSSLDLFDMEVVFESYDDHSGLHNIHWALTDYEDVNVVHGEGQIAVRRPNMTECSPPNCGCIPKDNECYDRDYSLQLDASKLTIPIGNHDHDYMFTFTVTNNAMLKTVTQFQVTVDISPPHEGAVHDSLPGESDLDYQQDTDVVASWDGFFDRESGVLFYAYFFGDSCATDDMFALPTSLPVINTTSTHASWTAPGPGTYHCTVVAFNRALEPSKPVCSDGVTIDTTPPTIREVNIEDVRVKPGLLKDSDGAVWMVDKIAFRHLVVNFTEDCSLNARLADDIDLWPISDSESQYTGDVCAESTPLSSVAYYTRENHFSLSWNGKDDESGIFDYEIGLSSSSSDADPDIMPLTSTHSHQDFLTYHPNLAEGVQFYVVVKAINRAQLSTSKVIGPFFVEVTPPSFSGSISVDLQSHDGTEYLVAEWAEDAFYDDEDAEPLSNLQYGVGTSPHDTNILSFTNIDNDDDTVCQRTTPPSCVAIATDQLDWHLHGDHSYYVFVRVENTAGLVTVVNSDPYRHVVQKPYKGVVFEVAPEDSSLFGASQDIDYQSSTSTLHCRWSGFSHQYLDVQYEVGLGTTPGDDDVIAFSDVSSGQTSKTFDSLSLELFKQYFVTVRASNEVGSVTVSSDGVIVLADNDVLPSAQVNDGLGCTNKVGSLPEEQESLGNKSHHDNDGRHVCQDDIDYQASTSSIAANWKISPEIEQYVTHVYWAIQRQESVNGSLTWDFISEYEDLRMAHTMLRAVQLMSGDKYRSIVKFCHPAGCFQPVHSNGFQVLPNPPISDGISQITYYNTTKELQFSWNPFTDDIPTTNGNSDSMDYYEWSLSVKTSSDNHHGDALYPWTRISNAVLLNDQLTYSAMLDKDLDFTACIQVGLRGYSKTGLSTTVYGEGYDCKAYNPVLIVPNIVIDAAGAYSEVDGEVSDIQLELNAHWKEPDAEYTPAIHKISAVWPSLRYNEYEWKVLSDYSIQRLAYWKHDSRLDYEDYDCDSPETMACGSTQDNFINVNGLQLKHGRRYFVCIHANTTKKVYERSEEILPAISSCSDGVTVDHTPPIAGSVWIGWGKHNYQTSNSELVISWESFVDVEEEDQTTHYSGVRKYEYAIGTSPGGVDIQDFINVGLTNHVVAHGLNLQSGQTYYATVRGTDYVGLTAKTISEGVTVDTTPPLKTDVSFDVGGAFHTSTKSISASWEGLFIDLESGIARYEWSVGSQPGFADIMAFTPTTSEEATSDESVDLGLEEGHFYYVSVKGYNGAGLSTLATSWAIVVDSSPPIAGFVYDGIATADVVDQDYQTDILSITARWKGFNDPHTDIVSYTWTIGTCVGCSDTMEEQDVGVLTEMTATDLNLQPGFKYYVTVTACNAADLCTTVTSDGIVVDNSPPIAGMVYDGVSDGDINYQASRTSIAAHWYGFNDPQSMLSHYEWRAGTTQGGDDIVQNTKLHLTEKVFISQLSQSLPVNTVIYITLRSVNKAGLYVETSSNGFTVDDTSPVVSTSPVFDNTLGSLKDDTQVWRSLLKVQWRFDDDVSHIVTQKVSVFTHHQAKLDIEPVQLGGSDNEYTFTDLDLHDGDRYYVRVIACNGAKLCTSRDTSPILVDSTPPTVGMYAVDTEHAAGLTRHRDGWMTYEQTQGSAPPHVKLAWLGFADIHSGIDYYYVTVGTTFSGKELTLAGPVMVGYQSGDPHYDEGVVQTAVVNVDRNLVPGEHIYVTVWAINEVGLRSYEAHDTFEVIMSNSVSGILSLVRRCPVKSCSGHCTCAPQNQYCESPGGSNACNDVTGDTSYQQLQIFDVTNYRLLDTASPQDIDFTPSKCAMAASWKATSTGSNPVLRYEWSAGISGSQPGSGVFDLAFDRIWHDIGQNTDAVLTVQRSIGSLEPLVDYVFYVKAWYSDDTYAIFQSDGITADFSPTEISKSRKVKEVSDFSKLVDIDFTTSTSDIRVSWKGVFRENEGDINNFAVSLSTHIGGEDISTFTDTVVQGSELKVQLQGLQLQQGIRYFCNVRAHNLAGLYSTASSDGFVVDITNPTKGVVYDGLGLHDADYQNNTDVVAASWKGFTDLESFIDYYRWCVGSSPGNDDILPCENVGLRLSASRKLTNPLYNGQQYFSKVVAVDAAGLESDVAISNGITADETAPIVEERFSFGENLLDNPSFEEWDLVFENVTSSSDGKSNDDLSTSNAIPIDWEVNGKATVVTSTQIIAQDGNSYVQVYGDIAQDFPSVVGEKYRVIFYCSHIYPSHTPLVSQEGFVRIPGVYHAFRLYQRPGRHDSHHNSQQISWHRHVYYFTAAETVSSLVLGSLGTKSGMAIDNVQVHHVGLGSRDPPSNPNPINQYTSPVHVETQVLHDWNSIHASWNMADLESPITEYMWAIGTVEGGTQLQAFTSVGSKSHGQNDDLHLSSGSSVHVTVVGKNAAGLRTVTYSDPILVDLTPPQLCCIKDGKHEDVQYQSNGDVTVSWQVEDEESGVDYCEWAIGLSPGSAEVLPFSKTDSLTSSETQLSPIVNGQTLYSTVRCHNYAGLQDQITSDGVTIVTEQPEADHAVVSVTASSMTHYPTQNSHQSQTDNINIAWQGFQDVTGIEYYLCKVQGEDLLTKWYKVGSDGQHFTVFKGLQLHSYKVYQVYLKAVNFVGLESDVVVSNITVETESPVALGNDIVSSWPNHYEVVMNWDGIFHTNSSLFYEVTIGSVRGGSDVLKWTETSNTEMRMTGLDHTREHYVAITAINQAGLFHTENYVISYTTK
ncbi:uncharacterized protein [Ptychodera flava]|uniref:uncharacterized protein n=1 Tax=Ptychodera flava TaxID=63121 RepID=UPI00396A7608